MRIHFIVVTILAAALAATANATDTVPHGAESGDCGDVTNLRSGSSGEYVFGHSGSGWSGGGGWVLDGIVINRANSSESLVYSGLAETYSYHSRCTD